MAKEVSIRIAMWVSLVKFTNLCVFFVNRIFNIRHRIFGERREYTKVVFLHLDNPFGPFFNIVVARGILKLNSSFTFTFLPMKASNICEVEANSQVGTSFRTATELIESFCDNQQIYSSNVRVGIMSDYRRNAKPVHLVGEKITQDKEVLFSIKKSLKYSTKLANQYDVFILPDVAYTFEHNLVEIART